MASNTFTKIATVTVGSGGAANIEFTSIPSTYADLAIYVSGRSSRNAGTSDDVQLFLNGSSSSYSDRELSGNGASASSSNNATTGMYDFVVPSNTATASTFGSSFIYIPNYAGSNNKSVSGDVVTENNATTAYALIVAGLWSNTAAITSVKFACDNGNFMQNSTATLYGIKNS